MSSTLDEQTYPIGYGMIADVVRSRRWDSRGPGVGTGLHRALAFLVGGTVLGVGLERALETGPPTSRERWLAVFLGIVGVVAGGFVFLVLFD